MGLEARVEDKIARMPDGCWYWTASLNTYGYGQLNIDGRPHPAHRAVWTALVAPIPDGLELHHRCETRSCVNPQHLQLVTRREHVHLSDSIAAANAAKTHCPQGHPYDDTNTWRRRGKRECRTCVRARNNAAARRRTGGT